MSAPRVGTREECRRRASTCSRTWGLLDLSSKGRLKAPSEAKASGDWPLRHDEYEVPAG